MNDGSLKVIFRQYVEQFDAITYNPHFEIYKWEIANDFRARMDAALASAPEERHVLLRELLVKQLSNTINNSAELPGPAICDYMRLEPETMTALLTELFHDDGGDLDARQKRIDRFSAGCDRLKAKYFPDSYKYNVGQRAAMVLLGFYDPDNNYIYKASQATKFADCVEFIDDFGTYAHFNMSVYYKMCDQLVAAMRADEALMEKHRSRFVDPANPLYADKNLHLLAFDMIYSGAQYDLYRDIPQNHITSKQRKEYLENCRKAEEYAAAVDAAQAKLDLFHESNAFYLSLLHVGDKVYHKRWGEGTVISCGTACPGGDVTAAFADHSNGTFAIAQSIKDGILRINRDGLAEMNERYGSVINLNENVLKNAVKDAKEKLKPYEKYLD